MKTKLVVISVLFLVINLYAGEIISEKNSPEIDGLMKQAEENLYREKMREGLKALDSVLTIDSTNVKALYLKGETYLLYGSTATLKIIDKLKKLSAEKEADILSLKLKLFLGDGGFYKELTEMKKKYPSETELVFAEWIYRLSNGEYEWAKLSYKNFVDDMNFGFIPFSTLFSTARTFNIGEALTFAGEAEKKNISLYDKMVLNAKIQKEMPDPFSDLYEEELPFADCGPYFGIVIEDSLGNKLKLGIDTGTNGNMLTIHSAEKGNKLDGEIIDSVENGIQYNYMKKAATVYHKAVSFKSPPIKNQPVKYFEGNLISEDGVFSPFAFKDLAVTLDPINKKAYIRCRTAFKNYLKRLGDKNYVRIPYTNRHGWIFIPVKINGKETTMMIESGSRDVNLNALSAKYYGIPTYESTLIWNGKESQVTKTDFTIQVGEITYKVKGGLIGDFVLGNTFDGLGAAGDIGPDFLKNFIFTVDPFDEALIIEKKGKYFE